jgi:hypothetical protein
MREAAVPHEAAVHTCKCANARFCSYKFEKTKAAGAHRELLAVDALTAGAVRPAAGSKAAISTGVSCESLGCAQ